MRARDFRHAAWAHLHGNWGTMALSTLVFTLILGACASLTLIAVGGVAWILLGGAMFLGFSALALTTARGVAPRFEQLFDGFRNYTSSLVLYILVWIFTLLWTLLFVIPGIIMSYAYSMSWYILADNPDMPANEARKRSIAMMRGNKWRLFCLDFSFIGWIILCALTLGILTFWIMPYMHTARAEFYQDLLAREYAAYQARNAAAQAAAGGDTTSGTAQAAAGENAANAAQEAIGEGPANDAQ